MLRNETAAPEDRPPLLLTRQAPEDRPPLLLAHYLQLATRLSLRYKLRSKITALFSTWLARE